MKVMIKNIHIFTTDGEENVFNFSDSLTFLYGNVGAGKTTMLNLIMYGFGGDLIYTPAVVHCLQAVQIETVLGGRTFLFFRMSKSRRIQIDDISGGRRWSLLKDQMSSFIYEQCQLQDIYQSIGSIQDRKQKVSFANFCWFSYLRQSEMDSGFFNLDSDNVYKQNAAVNALFSFLDSDVLMDQEINQRSRKLRRRIRKFEDGVEVFKYLENIFSDSKYLNKNMLDSAMEQLKDQMADIFDGKEKYNRNELLELLEMQTKLDCLKHRKAYEIRRERYNKKLEDMHVEMDAIARQKLFEQSVKNPSVQKLLTLFLDCLVKIGFRGVTKFDTIHMDPKTYMPIISNPYENREVSFENLGSGGKKTMFKICFALAIHRLQHAKQELNYLPSFLIIDTPMKNISEREDAIMYDSFYQYLFQLFSTELSDTQLFIVDKEKRDLSAYQFRKDAVLMRMTCDEWMSPPLFRNYKGL